MSKKDEAAALADALDAVKAQDERIAALEAENAKLRTVMIAAAEEIHEHWEAHCDAEGYGPANLMRRLEDGIAVEYGYTAGAFAEQRKRVKELEAAVREARDALKVALRYSTQRSYVEGCSYGKNYSADRELAAETARDSCKSGLAALDRALGGGS